MTVALGVPLRPSPYKALSGTATAKHVACHRAREFVKQLEITKKNFWIFQSLLTLLECFISFYIYDILRAGVRNRPCLIAARCRHVTVLRVLFIIISWLFIYFVLCVNFLYRDYLYLANNISGKCEWLKTHIMWCPGPGLALPDPFFLCLSMLFRFSCMVLFIWITKRSYCYCVCC